MPRTIERTYTHTDQRPSINRTMFWCKTLSTHAHRFCDQEGCDCECHRNWNVKNYEKNRLSSVRRVG